MQTSAFTAKLRSTKFTSLFFVAVVVFVAGISFFAARGFSQTSVPSYQQTASVDGGSLTGGLSTTGPNSLTGQFTAAQTDIELLPAVVNGVQTLNGSSMSLVNTTGSTSSTASASTKAIYYIEIDTSVSPPPSTVALDVVGTILESVGSAQGQATAFVGFGEAALLPQFPLSISTGAADMNFPFNVEVNVPPNTALPIVLGTSVSLSGLLGTVSAQIDPYVQLDPSVPNSQQYQLTFRTTPPSLYVVNPIVGIIGFSIGSDGALTPIAGSPFTVNGAEGIAVVPSGKFAYVLNGNLLAYAIGSNGTLTLVGSYAAGNVNATGKGYGVITDPLGKFVYVASVLSESGQIYGFSIGSNGALTPVPGSPIAVGEGPTILAIEPDREFMYIATSVYPTNKIAVSVYGIGVDGALTALPNLRLPTDKVPTFAAAPDPNGTFLFGLTGVHDISGFNVGAEGALTPLPRSPLGAGTTAVSLTVDPTGTHVYVTDFGGDYVSAYSIASNGALYLIPGSNVATGAGPNTIAVDPTGQFVYVANTASSSISAYRTGSNGVLTPIPGSPFIISPSAEPLSLVIAP